MTSMKLPFVGLFTGSTLNLILVRYSLLPVSLIYKWFVQPFFNNLKKFVFLLDAASHLQVK